MSNVTVVVSKYILAFEMYIVYDRTELFFIVLGIGVNNRELYGFNRLLDCRNLQIHLSAESAPAIVVHVPS